MDTAADTVPNKLTQNLKVAEEDESVRCDASAKKRIAERFIEREPEIGTLAVHRNHPDREGAE